MAPNAMGWAKEARVCAVVWVRVTWPGDTDTSVAPSTTMAGSGQRMRLILGACDCLLR